MDLHGKEERSENVKIINKLYVTDETIPLQLATAQTGRRAKPHQNEQNDPYTIERCVDDNNVDVERKGTESTNVMCLIDELDATMISDDVRKIRPSTRICKYSKKFNENECIEKKLIKERCFINMTSVKEVIMQPTNITFFSGTSSEDVSDWLRQFRNFEELYGLIRRSYTCMLRRF
jgi:hypothetical protein